MNGKGPTLKDISFNVDWFPSLGGLTGDEFALIMRMTAQSACNQVWTYSPPSNGGVTADPKKLARIAGLSNQRLAKASHAIDQYFRRCGDFYYPKRDWFSIQTRPPIPASTRSAVLQRDQFTCCYCGSKTGPFEIDHVVPFSRGGHPTDAENLITACFTCNREKRDRTPEEWAA